LRMFWVGLWQKPTTGSDLNGDAPLKNATDSTDFTEIQKDCEISGIRGVLEEIGECSHLRSAI